MSDQVIGKGAARELGGVFLVVGIGRVGTISLGLISTILLVQGLTPTEFAHYSITFGFVALLSLLALFGSETTITRDSASALALGDMQKARAAAGSDIFSTAIFSIATALITVFVVPSLPIMPDIPHDLVGICGFWVVAMSMNRVAGEWLRGSRRVVAATLFNGLGPFGGLFNNLMTLVLLLALWATGQMTLRHVLIASSAVYFTAFAIAVGIGVSAVGLASVRAAFDHWINNFRSSFYIYVMQILQFGSSQQTYILLASFMFDVQVVALLAVALRLYAMASTVLVTVTQASSELIVRLNAEKDHAGLERVVRLASSIAFVMASGIAVALALLRPEGFRYVFGPEYEAAYGVSLIFIVAAIVNGWAGLATRVLTLLGYVEAALATQILTVLAIVALAIPLGLSFGVYGFAAGCVIAGVVQRLVAGTLALRRIGVHCYAYLDPNEYISIAQGVYARAKRRAF